MSDFFEDLLGKAEEFADDVGLKDPVHDNETLTASVKTLKEAILVMIGNSDKTPSERREQIQKMLEKV